MDTSYIKVCIFNAVWYFAGLAVAVYVLAKPVFQTGEQAEESEAPIATPLPPPPEDEKHGGVKCEACGKDDPDRKAFVNDACKHVICERCVEIGSKIALLQYMELCPDGRHRVRLWDGSCKVCTFRNGYIRPYKAPIVRSPPTISVLPSLFRSASSMVEVTVGARTESTDSFTAPGSILTGRSKTFERRLQGNTNAARDKKLKLPDHDPKVFGYVLEFMYSGKIVQETIGTDPKPKSYDFFDIWALANFLEMDEPCNYCAWSILTHYDASHRLDFTKLGNKYSIKDASDLMKKLIVDLRVWSTDGMKGYWRETWPATLLSETANGLRNRILANPCVSPLDRVENYYTTPSPPPPPTT